MGEHSGEDQPVNEIQADMEAAFADIDPLDTESLYARFEQVLDDIHTGRF